MSKWLLHYFIILLFVRENYQEQKSGIYREHGKSGRTTEGEIWNLPWQTVPRQWHVWREVKRNALQGPSAGQWHHCHDGADSGECPERQQGCSFRHLPADIWRVPSCSEGASVQQRHGAVYYPEASARKSTRTAAGKTRQERFILAKFQSATLPQLSMFF